MRYYTQQRILKKISASIKPSKNNIELVTDNRRFIKNGWLIKMGRNRPQKYLFFLFSDLLFYCKPDIEQSQSTHPPLNLNMKLIENTTEQKVLSPVTKKMIIDNNSSSMFGCTIDELKVSTIHSSVVRPRKFSHELPSTTHDYNDTIDLSTLFGNRKSRKSRTKMFDSDDDLLLSLSKSYTYQEMEINNDFKMDDDSVLPCLKVHNYLSIDSAFKVKDFRLLPQSYDNLAFEIHSMVKSFIVMSENEKSKKEWMTVLNQCSNRLKSGVHQYSRSDVVSMTPVHSAGSNFNSVKVFSATLYLPDTYSDKCMKCKKSFNVTRRKKHCHHCGLLVCSRCLTQKLPPFNYFKDGYPVKVCDDCQFSFYFECFLIYLCFCF